jgi:tol-pal system protein YbgF
MMKFVKTAAVACAVWALWLGVGPAGAQDYESLQNQVEQLRQQVRQLTGLVNDLSRSGASGLDGTELGEGGGGETGNSPAVLVRLDEITESVRRLNGRMEEIEFKVDNLARGLDTVKRDVDLRLATPPTGQGSATAGVAGQAGAAATNLDAGASSEAATASTAEAGYNQSQSPRTLGSLPIDPGGEAGGGQADSSAPATQGPKGGTKEAAIVPASPKEQYDAARQLLKEAQYAEAETAFRAFIDGNPKDPNVEKAAYWLGETYYARKNFDEASQVYARNVQQWPKGEKAPDNLVKLSLSLANLKRNEEACQFLLVLESDYPKATSNVKQAAERAKKQAKCK